MRRSVLALLALLGAVSVLTPARPAAAQDNAFTARLVELTNQARRAEGLVELQIHTPLAGTSCDWNARIKDDESLPHDPQLREHIQAVIPNLRAWGENLAFDQSADHLFDAWMASRVHRDNILKPVYRLLGICSDVGRDGRTRWVTQRFATEGQTATTSAPKPTQPKTTKPPATTAPTTAAPTTTVPTTAPPVTEPPTTTTTTAPLPTTTTLALLIPPTTDRQMALEVENASADRDGLSPGLVVGVVLSSLVLMSAGILVISRSRRRDEEL